MSFYPGNYPSYYQPYYTYPTTFTPAMNPLVAQNRSGGLTSYFPVNTQPVVPPASTFAPFTGGNYVYPASVHFRQAKAAMGNQECNNNNNEQNKGNNCQPACKSKKDQLKIKIKCKKNKCKKL